MEFYNHTGKVAIGSRLRLLTDKITDDAAAIYKMYEVDLSPKWFPVFRFLEQSAAGITEIAQQIGHSHPSVSKIVTEMLKAGIVKQMSSKSDARKSIIALTPKGKKISEKLSVQCVDVNTAVEEMLQQTKNDLWKAIGEWEYLLNQKNLLRRVVEHKKLRESQDVQIVPYSPKFKRAFRDLNEEWISKYFRMEATDYKALDNPHGYILKPGGHILVALYKGEAVGVCALIKMKDGLYDFELAKMAVSPAAQGKNIGFLLGRAAINLAKKTGASKLYLESNTILTPAINLYNKLGFRKIAGHPTPYERCNIQMELDIKSA